MNRRFAVSQTVFHVLALAGCTLLSTHLEPGANRPDDQLLLALVPLILGIGGTAYLAFGKHNRDSWLHGFPVIAAGVVVSVLLPSTFTRILVLCLFVAVILGTAWKQRQNGGGR